MKNRYDIAIIGGGPGGYSAAIRAAQLGAKVAIFEENKLGGTCLNVGCIPTKYLLEKVALLDKIKENTINGILKDPGYFSWKKIQERKQNIIGQLTSGVERILNRNKIEIIKEKAFLNKDRQIISFTSQKKYKASKIIIATGSNTFIPKIQGIYGKNVINSTKALSLKKIPKSMTIVGGGIIGIEFACIYSSLGTKVTILEKADRIISGEDAELVSELKKNLIEKGIIIITAAEVNRISDGSDNEKVVHFLKDNVKEFTTSECVLLAIGRIPRLESIDVEGLNIKLNKNGSISVDQFMQTNIKNIYAVGDVAGNYQLAHSAYKEAECAAENALGRNEKVDLEFVPRCVYSNPQLATVGLIEEEAKNNNIEYSKSIYPYQANGKALVMGKKAGFVKVLVDKNSKRILGIHILGEGATEIISGSISAINLKATNKELGRMIFPHPTLSEMLKEAALMIDNEAIHI